ncbi:hypothetical protein PAXRUDRAFT_836372 [Paxillus rubicundulus Ve08.2h10]|uniref:Uncharacterized protein n=1 Tax=Paxillus rubicundulus Ve08.2h10 TaxID=930991 RepID=A0A0D0CZA1_9AGAM|nr:hypothetical protein PAXRUDRAFT_836372 [Paxillus rubicundulus Ve08.2h10]
MKSRRPSATSSKIAREQRDYLFLSPPRTSPATCAFNFSQTTPQAPSWLSSLVTSVLLDD